MKDHRRDGFWAAAGLFALALTIVASSKATVSRRAGFAAEGDLRDAVASSVRPTAGLAGKPVPTAWFKTPEQSRAAMDDALFASRRRRASAAR